ncbi:MAG: AAA family ATPase [Gemmatimonadaceae bacterium]|nr:AAA family ATPase [Gemmatimonadaceae bacterium]
MTYFTHLKLSRWRQFESVALDLSDRLVVLTGPNGCGKTTLLSLLGRHFGWNQQFLSSPLTSKRQRRRYSDAWDAEEQPEISGVPIGTLGYSEGHQARIVAPVADSTQTNIQLDNQRPVAGIHIPSHRPPPGYARLQNIPIDPKTSEQHFQAYQNFLFQSYGESPRRNPSVAMKEALIGFAVFGEGNSSVSANQEYEGILRGFESILGKLLPQHLGFERIEIDTPEVLLRTRTGRFPLESMSGGLNAIFGIAWQIHMHAIGGRTCTVLLDEPENHLHPSMQREFLPRLLDAFPDHRFVVATHSPFVVASSPVAAVYGLLFGTNQRVTSRRLEHTDLAGSPQRLLRDVLDVPVVMPLWVEARIKQLLSGFADRSFDADAISELRERLREEGLESAFGDYLVQAPLRGESSLS